MRIYKLVMNVRRNLLNFYYNIYLKSIDNMISYYDFINKLKWNDNFYFYKNNSLKKRKEFLAVTIYLNITLKDINFLDIGPGFGDAIDICHENGANQIDFIDNSPFFYHYNRLKGFTNGYFCNLITGITKLPPKKYNLIWLKSSINVEYFIKREKLKIPYFSLNHWLEKLNKLAAKDCHLIICPLWESISGKRIITDLYDNSFTHTMMQDGFIILPQINNFCGELAHPFAFYKVAK